MNKFTECSNSPNSRDDSTVFARINLKNPVPRVRKLNFRDIHRAESSVSAVLRASDIDIVCQNLRQITVRDS